MPETRQGRFESTDFDERYYRRYYDDPATRVGTADDVGRRAAFVAAYLDMLEIRVASVLDLGAGRGWWRAALARHYPHAEYVGVELSDAACSEHGWEKGSVVDYDPGEPADLVLCIGVLQYLDARAARRAIDNLARCTESALFLEALTRGDWREVVDRERTDGDVYLRDAHWYRRALDTHFVCGGGGLFFPRDAEPPLFELERL